MVPKFERICVILWLEEVKLDAAAHLAKSIFAMPKPKAFEWQKYISNLNFHLPTSFDKHTCTTCHLLKLSPKCKIQRKSPE